MTVGVAGIAEASEYGVGSRTCKYFQYSQSHSVSALTNSWTNSSKLSNGIPFLRNFLFQKFSMKQGLPRIFPSLPLSFWHNSQRRWICGFFESSSEFSLRFLVLMYSTVLARLYSSVSSVSA